MHVPRICESVTGQTMADLLNGRNASEADLVELRLDGVADLDVPALLAGRTLPVILTCRPTWEGGRFQGSETDRLRILSHGLDAGADFIDVEFHARAESLIACAPERVIVSMHDFGGVPGDLASRVREMRGTGAGLIKVAVMATCLSDLIPLLAIGQPGDALVIGMGAAGLLTRLLPERFGSPWSYGGSGVAPGQVPVHRMRQEYGFGAHSANAQVYGVVGNRAAHSAVAGDAQCSASAGDDRCGVRALCHRVVRGFSRRGRHAWSGRRECDRAFQAGGAGGGRSCG